MLRLAPIVGAKKRTPLVRGRFVFDPTWPAAASTGRVRHDECLNEHWFTSLRHAQVVLEVWVGDFKPLRY